MIKIFDCSNSNEKPSSRGYGGPVMNEFVALMHKYAPHYGCLFVDELNDANVVFTNDIFPSYVRGRGVRLVKRMDGIFFQKELIHRNEPFIESASIADCVIFITQYSKNSMKAFYPHEFGQLTWNVVTHWTDPGTFTKIPRSVDVPSIFTAMATNWNRSEKRLNALIKFAKLFPVTIHLIGKSDGIELPKNIIPHGYLSDQSQIYNIMKQSHAFINLTYKDAATKTVCTAINYGLPILYANSGGVSEMVGRYGVGVHEPNDFAILESIPSLSDDAITDAYGRFKDQYIYLYDSINRDPEDKLGKSLEGYFEVIKRVSYFY
jgi:glycosyltransferase involved in cell wall biosynthesis